MSGTGSANRTGHRSQRGFTLIELLVVLTVIALLMSLAVPLFDRAIPGRQLEIAANSLEEELRQARSGAIQANRDAYVEIDVANGSYRRIPGGRLRQVPASVTLSLLTATSEQLDGARGRIRFFPDGTSTGGRITFSDAGLRHDVGIDWFDGRVSSHETAAE